MDQADAFENDPDDAFETAPPRKRARGRPPVSSPPGGVHAKECDFEAIHLVLVLALVLPLRSPTESAPRTAGRIRGTKMAHQEACRSVYAGSSGATKSSLDCARCCSVTRLMDMSVLRSTSPTTSHQPSVLLLG